MSNSEAAEFTSADGQQLAAVIDYPETAQRGWALFAHCFTCSKDSLAAKRIARALAADGIGVVRFDFTGLGESDGEFAGTGFSSNVDDLVSAANWMAETGRTPGLLVGHSLGGSAAVVAASRIPTLRAVATIGAPSEAEHVVRQFGEQVEEIEARGEAIVDLAGRPFTIRQSFLAQARAADVRGAAADMHLPLMVMHSPQDHIVGIDNASGLFLAARHPKSFVSLDGADHLLGRRSDAEFAAGVISAWAARYLDDPAGEGKAPKQSHDAIVRETGEESQFQNEVFIDGRRFLADEPRSFGGSETGPTPYDWVAAGLGACTSMTLRMYANRQEWFLDRVTVRVNHSREHAEDCKSCEPGAKVDVFTREIQLEGQLSEDERQRLLEIAEKCPVHRTLAEESVIRTKAWKSGS